MEKRESTTTLPAALPERSDRPAAQWKPLVAASLGLMPLGAMLFFVSDRPAGLADWGSYLFIVGVVTLLAGLSSAWVDRKSGRLAAGTTEGGDAEEETVQANIQRLVGGAGEETILARVGEGIVSTIGSSEGHKAMLENPEAISRTVLAKGLDAGTAYEILSIDSRTSMSARTSELNSKPTRPRRTSGLRRRRPRSAAPWPLLTSRR